MNTPSPPDAAPPVATTQHPHGDARGDARGDVHGDVHGDDAAFIVDVEGFEGPLDVLLSLARAQKVDLLHISILQLAEQYLAFVARARKHNLELAADYLVMAAWLTYLKSKLLLPEKDDDQQPDGEEMAAVLAFQLQRLEAMHKAADDLFALPRLGCDFFPRGEEEPFNIQFNVTQDSTLQELIHAYADIERRRPPKSLSIEANTLDTTEQAVERLREMLGKIENWSSLWHYLPRTVADPLVRRSHVAATFGAGLELARLGVINLRQEQAFGPIMIRTNHASSPQPHNKNGTQ